MGPHRGLSAARSFACSELPIGVDLVLESGHESPSRRLGDLAPVVAGCPRQSADTGHLTTNDGIARRHGYVGATGKLGGVEAGEMRRRALGTASVK